MGWIAAGAGTFLAACLLYSLITRHNDNDLRLKTVITEQHRSEEKAVEHVRKDEPPAKAPNGKISNGSIPAPPTIIAPDQPTAPSIPTITTQAMPPPPLLRTSPSKPANSTMLPPPRPTPPRNSSPPRLKPPSMGPPPRPSAAASLRVPTTKVLSSSHMQPASSTLPLPTTGSAKKSRQITLLPGYSPLDWAHLSRNPASAHKMRGADFAAYSPTGALLKIPPSLLKKQTGRKGKDAWTSYQGRVYNITPYLPFHPGGKSELMRAAGREGEALFMEVHPWVNWEGMLSECLVGILVGEGEGTVQEQNDSAANGVNELDEMD